MAFSLSCAITRSTGPVSPNGETPGTSGYCVNGAVVVSVLQLYALSLSCPLCH